MTAGRPDGRTADNPPGEGSHPPSGRRAALPSRFTFHLIPHTHWDREWYLTRAEFQARLVPVLDQVLEQLERDAAARFLLDGQAILLEDYLAIRPDQEARVRAQVERGALEIGPWYVLSDLLIPSVESLRRNLREGRRLAERFGRRLDVLYSPDAFGHPAALPAIAAEFGLTRAVIRRGLGRPGDFYRWEAAGGASLLVHHLPPSGYDGAIGLATAADLGRAWRLLRQELVERATTREIAVFLGADHHAMVRGVSALARKLQALEPGNTVRVSGLGEYFAAVEQVPPKPPLLEGALRSSRGITWDLQDVHSSRSRLKRRHADVELRLARLAEPLLRAAPEQQPVLDQAWRTLLQCQFHDTLAGTTCDEAQQEQAVRLDGVDRVSRALAASGLEALLGEQSEPGLVLWNPVERVRSGVVTGRLTFFRRDILVGLPSGRTPRAGPGFRPIALAIPGGRRIPVQLLAVGPGSERRDDPRRYPDQDEVDQVWLAFDAAPVPGLGFLPLEPTPSNARAAGRALVTEPATLDNRMVQAQCAPSGQLSLTDVGSGASLDGLLRLVDEPDQGDLYTFSRGGDPDPGSTSPVSQSTLAAGPLLGAVETRWTARFRRGALGLRSVATLYGGSPLLRLRLEIEHAGSDHRLRLRFPVGAGRIMAGATLGTEEPVAAPPPAQPFGLERGVSTRPAHRFVAALGRSATLAVFAPGFFEYEWTPKGDLLITGLRAVGELSRGELPERPGHAAWPIPTPEAQEPGRHTLNLALAILPPTPKNNDLPTRLERMWEDAFLPIQCFYRRAANSE
jgi:hypothetical protein